MAKHLTKIGPVLIMIAASLWALDGILRRSLYTLNPLLVVFYEHLFGALLLLPVAIRDLPKVVFTRKILFLTLAVSLVSGLGGTLFFTAALGQVEYIPFSVVLLLQKLQPIFAISAAALILKERIDATFVLWAIIALVASFFVTFPNGQINLESGDQALIAAGLAVAAAAAWGFGTVLSKLLLRLVPVKIATTLRFYTTTLLALVAVALTGQLQSLFTISAQQVMTLVIITASTGLVALWIYYLGLRTTQAKVATIVELIFPLLAVLIDVLLFDSQLLMSQYVAAMVLLLAIWQVGSNTPPDKLATTQATQDPAQP